MNLPKTKFTTVDQYIAAFSKDIQMVLKKIRQTIRESAPQATEIISYNMPAYKQNKVLVYFAGNKNHLGFYPTPEAIFEFAQELKPYKTSKGAVQFDFDKPIPYSLIKRIVKFKVQRDKLNDPK
ncbi:MAG: DUF1801 domain-containing protein [Candidatus Doudnabacteria bacterium]